LTRHRAALLIAQSLLGLVLLAAWLWLVDLKEIGRTLSHARWTFVALAVGVGLLTGVLRTVRWRILLRPLAEVPLLDLWMVMLASTLVNFLIPLRAGEVARTLFLKQRRSVPIAASLATVAVDRAFDLAAVLALGGAGAIIVGGLEGRAWPFLLAGIVLIIAFAVFVGLAIFGRERQLAVVAHLLPKRLGSGLRERILGTVERFLEGFSTVGRQPLLLGPLFGVSLLAAVLDSAAFYTLIASLGVYAAPIGIVLGYALYSLTFLVPAAPGYVGTVEAFGSLVFTSIGLAPEVAASVVVLNHALFAVTVPALGIVGLWGLGLSPASAVRSLRGGGEALRSDAQGASEGEGVGPDAPP
jgi:uncharacterized protein (TIRG00374 family)